MSQTSAEFSHLVDIVHTLSLEEVETVQILVVVGEEQLLVGLLHRDDCLEDGTLAVLDPLSHGVQVGREVTSGGEDALVVLALTLSIELLPPLSDVVELRLEVGHNLNLLASLRIECLAHSSILGADVVGVSHIGGSSLLHVLRTLHQGLDVEAGDSDGQQAHRREDRETAAHIVGDDESLVALLVGSGTSGALVCIGNSHDDILGSLLAQLLLALPLQQTERERSLGGRARLRDVDHAKLLTLQVSGELCEVVLADIVAGKQDCRILLIANQPSEAVAQSLDDSACAKIGTADAGDHHHLALLAQRVSHSLHTVEKLIGDLCGQVEPSQEIIAWASSFFQCLLSLFHFRFIALNDPCVQELSGFRNV